MVGAFFNSAPPALRASPPQRGGISLEQGGIFLLKRNILLFVTYINAGQPEECRATTDNLSRLLPTQTPSARGSR